MDNCGCAPGSMLTNQSDNLTGGGFSNNGSFNNNNNNNLGNNFMNNNNSNTVDLNTIINQTNNSSNASNASNVNNTSNVNINDVINNINNNANNANNALNKYEMPQSQMPHLQNNNNIKTTNEIIESIAKNNIADLNKLNKPEEIGKEVVQTAEETIALSKKHIMLASVFTLALAWNDAIKYYIGRNIKLNKASPFYYLYYALIVTVIAVVMHMLLA
jgi:hypothetical protein